MRQHKPRRSNPSALRDKRFAMADDFKYRSLSDAPAFFARGVIRTYQLTLSALAGRHCRHLPTCSDFTSEAIGRYGFWGGGWMGLARICRCRPGGTSGFDPVPEVAPEGADVAHFWRYGLWRGPLARDPVKPD